MFDDSEGLDSSEGSHEAFFEARSGLPDLTCALLSEVMSCLQRVRHSSSRCALLTTSACRAKYEAAASKLRVRVPFVFALSPAKICSKSRSPDLIAGSILIDFSGASSRGDGEGPRGPKNCDFGGRRPYTARESIKESTIESTIESEE